MMTKSTILLTGANGFLGSYLLEALLRKGHEVVVLKRSISNTWRIQHLISSFESFNVDIKPLEDAFRQKKIDVVVHTACHYGRNGESISDVVKSNVGFGLEVLDACLKFGVGTFVNTDTLLDKHCNAYSLSKGQFVEWLKQFSNKLKVINLRLEHMYGPRDDDTKFVPWCISQLQQNIPEMKLTRGVQLRDFIYIDDVVAAYLKVLENADDLSGFSEFDVGTGDQVTVKFFVEQLKEIYEEKFGPTNTQLAFGAIPYGESEKMMTRVDTSGLTQLGWKPATSLAYGIKTLF